MPEEEIKKISQEKISTANERGVGFLDDRRRSTFGSYTGTGSTKIQRERISSAAKQEEQGTFEWKSRSQLFYVLATYTITGDALMKVEDFSEVFEKLSLYHMLIVYGFFAIPLLYMELFLGQYSKLKCLDFGKMTPIAYGLGGTMILLAMARVSYSSCMLADAVLYAFRCLERPWLECKVSLDNMRNDYKCIPLPKSNEQGADLWSENENARLSSYIYWRNEILRTNDTSTEIFGTVVTARLISLICVWVFLCMLLLVGMGGALDFLNKMLIWIIGICSAILILFIMLTDGAAKYLSHMFWTNFHDLSNLEVYSYAVQSCIVSLSLSQGAYIFFGSYMKSTSSGSLYAVLIVLINITILLVAYILHFSSVGILSAVYKEKREDLHVQENDYVFATIPHALGVITFSRMMSFMYFLLLFCSYCGNVTAPVQYDCLKIHVLRVIRILVVTIETISVLWLYTFPRLCDDMHFYYGSQPAVYWKIAWAFLPFFSLIVLIYYCIAKHSYANCNNWSIILVFAGFLLPILIGALYKIYKNLRKHNLVAVLKAEDDWGPREHDIRILRNTMNPRMETRLNRRSYKCKHKCLLRSVYLKKVIADEEKWYNTYIGNLDSIGSKSEEEEEKLSEEEDEEEENEELMGEATAFSLYSQLSSIIFKSGTGINESRVAFKGPDPKAGTSSENQ